MDKKDIIRIMDLDQNSLPLAEAVDGFLAREPAYFCIPGHRMERGLDDGLKQRFGEGVFKYDLTEAPGLDDLHDAKGAIQKAQCLAAELYGARRTWFLVNGTSCGNEALMMAVAHEGDEVIVFRNAHYSIYAALVLSGAKPVWGMPEADTSFGFATKAKAEVLKELLNARPSAKAVFVVSPTYYGDVSDIRKLADICHEGHIPLIVDEAHGAHFYFNENFPKGALACGADAVVMSTHKTLGSMTQSSMLHLNSSLLDEERIAAALKMTMSSSPSYILMSSLDAARRQMALHGKEIMQSAFELSMNLRKRLSGIEGIDVYGGCKAKELLKRGIDPSRVVISAASLGLSGYELSDELFNTYSVATEMADMNCCVAVVTGANTKEDIERLINSVSDIVLRRKKSRASGEEIKAELMCSQFIPEMIMTPREAFFSEKESVALREARGRICAQLIAPYPPGTPILAPGEAIDERAIDALEYCIKNNIRLHGDGTEGAYIKVVKRP